jgi:DNA replication protein DnaC
MTTASVWWINRSTSADVRVLSLLKISGQYEKNSTIIISNKNFGDWQELFGDAVIATAILDRLLHHCKVVNIKGHSYRLKEHSIVKEQLEQKNIVASSQTMVA